MIMLWVDVKNQCVAQANSQGGWPPQTIKYDIPAQVAHNFRVKLGPDRWRCYI